MFSCVFLFSFIPNLKKISSFKYLFVIQCKTFKFLFNPLWPSVTLQHYEYMLSLVQVMAWHLFHNKPILKPILIFLSVGPTALKFKSNYISFSVCQIPFHIVLYSQIMFQIVHHSSWAENPCLHLNVETSEPPQDYIFGDHGNKNYEFRRHQIFRVSSFFFIFPLEIYLLSSLSLWCFIVVTWGPFNMHWHGSSSYHYG